MPNGRLFQLEIVAGKKSTYMSVYESQDLQLGTTIACDSTISNTRATFAYYSFCDNLRLQCTLRLLSLFAVIFKLILSEKK